MTEREGRRRLGELLAQALGALEHCADVLSPRLPKRRERTSRRIVKRTGADVVIQTPDNVGSVGR